MVDMEYGFNISLATRYGVEEAILIKNFQYWIRKNKENKKHFYEGRYWTYNSVKAFCGLFPFWSAKQIRRILKSLVSQGVIMEGNFNNSPYDRTIWYSFVDEREFLGENGVDFIENPICPNGKINFAKKENENSQMGNPIPNINTDNINTDNRKKKEINIKKKESISVSRCSTDDKTLIDLWNGIADRWTLPKIISITSERKKKINNIFKVFNIGYEEFFNLVEEGIMGSDFLRGKRYRWNPVIREYDIEDLSWRANFDFFLRESSFRKTVEGMYESADVSRYKKEGKWENVKRMWLSDSKKN